MKAEEIRQNTMDRQRCLVYQKIESAMEDGKFFLFYSNINNVLLEELRNDGFKIRKGNYWDEQEYIICW